MSPGVAIKWCSVPDMAEREHTVAIVADLAQAKPLRFAPGASNLGRQTEIVAPELSRRSPDGSTCLPMPLGIQGLVSVRTGAGIELPHLNTSASVVFPRAFLYLFCSHQPAHDEAALANPTPAILFAAPPANLWKMRKRSSALPAPMVPKISIPEQLADGTTRNIKELRGKLRNKELVRPSVRAPRALWQKTQ